MLTMFGMVLAVGILVDDAIVVVENVERIMREGTGADRQLAAWEHTQDMKAVVDQIVAETYEGLGVA
jgi:multidrug efflux pump subunit AcrB